MVLPYSTSNPTYRTFQKAICGVVGLAKLKRSAKSELSFLPSRSMKPQTIKLEYGDAPTDVFVHEFY